MGDISVRQNIIIVYIRRIEFVTHSYRPDRPGQPKSLRGRIEALTISMDRT